MKIFKPSILILLSILSISLFAKSKDTFSKKDTITNPKAGVLPYPDDNELDIIRENFKTYIPKNHDADLISDRLKCIDSEIPMDYHYLVLDYIKDYTLDYRHGAVKILNRTPFYFPIFDAALEKYDMPKELRNLAVVESALKPAAVSYAAAVGLWQFIPGTGRMYGLTQNHWIDERMDLYKSTDAACRYLKDLYDMFDDWHLAMAAYNCGPGRVQSALRISGGTNYWDIYDYLPRQTRNYVPKFIALTYITTYSEEHNLYADYPQKAIPSSLITIKTNTDLHYFADLFHIRIDYLWKLNPQLKRQTLPQNVSQYAIRIPAENKEGVDIYRAIEAGKYAEVDKRGAKFYTGKDDETVYTDYKSQSFHIVTEGEDLVNIATRYGVKVEDLKVWNRIEGEIKEGQTLNIWK